MRQQQLMVKWFFFLAVLLCGLSPQNALPFNWIHIFCFHLCTRCFTQLHAVHGTETSVLSLPRGKWNLFGVWYINIQYECKTLNVLHSLQFFETVGKLNLSNYIRLRRWKERERPSKWETSFFTFLNMIFHD